MLNAKVAPLRFAAPLVFLIKTFARAERSEATYAFCILHFAFRAYEASPPNSAATGWAKTSSSPLWIRMAVR